MESLTVEIARVRASTALLTEQEIEDLKQTEKWEEIVNDEGHLYRARHGNSGLTATGETRIEALENLVQGMKTVIESDRKLIREGVGWT
ncbi:hypothetical protein [Candidatus Halobonum tyrrellensis]|uniref:hypothetical protein n=1 Tax=Candidatus Halobonum tyrrellensis TaxID=1431545 RepID=UPI001267A2AE|nr:hypothetical protein [Candidatus Halobonum tyrrellensis]